MKRRFFTTLLLVLGILFSHAQGRFWDPTEYPVWDAVYEPGCLATYVDDSVDFVTRFAPLGDDYQTEYSFWGVSNDQYELNSTDSILSFTFQRQSTNSDPEWNNVNFTSIVPLDRMLPETYNTVADHPLMGTVVDMRENMTIAGRVFVSSPVEGYLSGEAFDIEIRLVDAQGYELNALVPSGMFESRPMIHVAQFGTWVDFSLELKDIVIPAIHLITPSGDAWSDGYSRRPIDIGYENVIPFDTAHVAGIRIYVAPGAILNMTTPVEIRFADITLGEPICQEPVADFTIEDLSDGNFQFTSTSQNADELVWSCDGFMFEDIDILSTDNVYTTHVSNLCDPITICTASIPPSCSNQYNITLHVSNECGVAALRREFSGSSAWIDDSLTLISPQPLLEDGKSWKQQSVNMGVTEAPVTYSVSGDTTLFGRDYKIVGNYFLREDTIGRVFMLQPDFGVGEEVLWYDFNVQVGDTIYTGTMQEEYIVDNVLFDATLGSVFRKIISLNGGTITWIEGVGDTRGLDAVEMAFSMIDCVCSSELLCCTRDGELLYNNLAYPNCGGYVSLLDEGRTWNVHYEFPPYVDPVDFIGSGTESYYFSGNDTLINGYTYTELVQEGSRYRAFLREEGEQVYHFNESTNEDDLWYDFSVNTIGDTIYVGAEMRGFIFDSVGTITTLDGVRRRVKYLSSAEDGIAFGSTIWIEGIGDTRGIAHSTAALGLIGATTYTLMCSSQDGELIYHNEAYPNCGEELYYPLLEAGKVWNVIENHSFCGAGGCNPYTSLKECIVENDTTINNIEYTIISGFGPFSRPLIGSSNDLRLPLRENDGRVYAFYNDTEYLLYDFNLSAGDTIETFQFDASDRAFESLELIVDSVYEAEFDGGVSRNVFHLSGYNGGGYVISFIWIEGIGDLKGLIREYSNSYNDLFTATVTCVNVDGVYIYTNENYLNCAPSLAFLAEGKTWTDVRFPVMPDPELSFSRYRAVEGLNLMPPQRYDILSIDEEGNVIETVLSSVYDFGGAIYQDMSDTTILLYNFAASVGDTVIVGVNSLNLIVSAVSDTVLLDGVTRRVQYMLGEDSEIPSVWIEGIGDTRGFMASTIAPGIIGMGMELVCVSDNNGFIYSNENYPNCGQIIEEFSLFEESKTWTDVSYPMMPDADLFFSRYRASASPILIAPQRYNLELLDENGDVTGVYENMFYQIDGRVFEEASGSTWLLYDFSANVGDTIVVGENSLSLIVDSVNAETQYDGSIRRVQYLSDLNGFGVVKWIDGIGDARGLLNSTFDPTLDGIGMEMVCVSDASGLIYSNERYPNCGQIIPNEYNVINIDTTFAGDSLYMYIGVSNWGGNTVNIAVDAMHAERSELVYVTDSEENTYYVYIPEEGFVGTDTVSFIRRTNGLGTIDSIVLAIRVDTAHHQIPELEVTYRVRNVSYVGGQDGVIDLNVTGGVAPFTFEWDNHESTEDLYGLEAGYYSVIVTDAEGQEVILTISVGVHNIGEHSIEGQVLMNGEGFSDCIVMLYALESAGTRPVAFDEVNTTGEYTFDSLPEADYILYAIPNPETQTQALPTYAYNSVLASGAFVLTLDGDVTHFNIQLFTLTPLVIGVGEISGVVALEDTTLAMTNMYNDELFAGLMKSEGGYSGSANIPVILMQDGEVVAWTMTDASGHYSFGELPLGNYTVQVEKPDGSMEQIAVSVSESNPVVNAIDFVITKTGVSTTAVAETAEVTVSVYPNPATATVSVRGTIVESVEILDLLGNIVLTSAEATVNIAELATGEYIVKIKSEKSEFVRLLIKE